jgi:hypothetical protein
MLQRDAFVSWHLQLEADKVSRALSVEMIGLIYRSGGWEDVDGATVN